MKHPYSTTHYHCGCHIVEDAPNSVSLQKSIYCNDNYEWPLDDVRCEYKPILLLRRLRGARAVC